MSEAQSGEKNHMFGKIGPTHPRSGKTHSQDTKNKMSQAKASLIYLYSLDLQLLGTFSSLRKITKYLKCTHSTIIKYIRSREIFKDQYILSLEELSSISEETQKKLSLTNSSKKLSEKLVQKLVSLEKVLQFL